MLPFSIFEGIPAEIPAAAPSSVTVRSIALRSRRTSKPMLASSGRTDGFAWRRRACSKTRCLSPARCAGAQAWPALAPRRDAVSVRFAMPSWSPLRLQPGMSLDSRPQGRPEIPRCVLQPSTCFPVEKKRTSQLTPPRFPVHRRKAVTAKSAPLKCLPHAVYVESDSNTFASILIRDCMVEKIRREHHHRSNSGATADTRVRIP